MTDDLGAAGLGFDEKAPSVGVLPAQVGVAVARDLLLSARRLDAFEAKRLVVIPVSTP